MKHLKINSVRKSILFLTLFAQYEHFYKIIKTNGHNYLTDNLFFIKTQKG